jgi:hypothetical protein
MMPVYDLSSGFAGLDNGIDSLGASLQSSNKQQLLQKLGAQLQSGDYDGAAATAFKTGDVNTGLAIQKLKQQQQASTQLAGAIQAPDAPAPSGSAPAATGDAPQGQSQAAPSAKDAYAEAISSIESGGKNGVPSSAPPAAQQQALTAQLPRGAAAASTAKIDALPHGDPAKLDYYLRMQALATQTGNDGYAALFKQKADIEKEALTPTTAQKNYEYYVRQELGAGRAPLSFKDYTNGTEGATNPLARAAPTARASAALPQTAQAAIGAPQGQPAAASSQAPVSPQSVPRPTLSPQEAARLPRGTRFIGIDGVERVRR